MRRYVALAAVLVMCALIPAHAEPGISAVTSGNIIQVIKAGPSGWRLRYGTTSRSASKPDVDQTHLVEFGTNRAYFSHGTCLRLVDTAKGIVIGRWLMPGVVTSIAADGDGKAKITFSQWQQRDKERIDTLVFDPSQPESVPVVFHEYIANNLLPLREAAPLDPGTVTADRARALIPEAREAVRRDPVTPWFQIMLGRLLQQAGDPEAEAVFERATRPPMEYPELLPISAYLEHFGMTRLADETFEKGYRSFLQNGNDPRLMTSIIGRLMLYPVDWKKVSPERRKTVAERLYQLGPYMERSDLAWAQYSKAATDQAQKKLWLDRANEARNRSGHIFGVFILTFDRLFLAAPAIGIGWWIYFLVLYAQYRKQAKRDKRDARIAHELPRPGSRILRLRSRIRFFHVQYWSFPQRIGIVLISVAGWFIYGWMGQSIRPPLLEGEAPVGMAIGSLEKPSVRAFLQNRLAATPERDLLLALSYQHAGERSKATDLYLRVPQYAESWNNLGVIRRSQGNESEAAEAFKRALVVDPELPEAAFNLGRPAPGYWTDIHRKYVPDTSMVAVPSQRVWWNAFAGGPLSTRCKRASLGPLRPWHVNVDSFTVTESPTTLSMVAETAARLILFLALLLLVMPVRPVTEEPGIVARIFSVVFPGTSRGWGYAGGLVLVLWLYLLFDVALTAKYGAPYILTLIATPNLMNAYGISVSVKETMAMLYIPRAWVYSSLALLFLANLWITFPAIRARFSGKSSESKRDGLHAEGAGASVGS